MELKKWEEYTKEEKTSLLKHWFNYYGDIPYTAQDCVDFYALAAVKPNKIFDHIATIGVTCNTIQTNILVSYMRKKQLKILFGSSITRAKAKEAKVIPARDGFMTYDEYEAAREEYVQEIVKSYNKPEHRLPKLYTE